MAEDPLSWHYRRAPGLRRRLARLLHLSVTSGFLGPRAMRTLGLTYMPPWYPLLRIPVNVVRSVAAMTLPGGRDRAAARGQREQKALLHTIIDDGEAKIGYSASHMSSVA